jgi:hypothetical protein
MFATGVLSHLGPNKEMLHRAFEHVKAVEYPIDIFRANMLLRLFEDRAAIFGAFWSSHDIPARKTMIVQ